MFGVVAMVVETELSMAHVYDKARPLPVLLIYAPRVPKWGQ